MKLQAGQVAVVTGGASGIGLAIAAAFGARGLSVVIADIEDAPLKDALDLLIDRGIPTTAVKTDVSNSGSVETLAQETLKRFGRVDVVCNNAGVNVPRSPLWDLEPADWEWVIGVNLRGVINGVRAFVPHLVERGEGHVVNTASVYGMTPMPFLGPYGVTKHSVIALSEILSKELQALAPGVGVTVLCPGRVLTNLRTSRRNRPSPLSVPARQFMPPAGSVPDVQAMEVVSAEDVGAQVVAAVEINLLHLFTHRASARQVRERFQWVESDLTACPLPVATGLD